MSELQINETLLTQSEVAHVLRLSARTLEGLRLRREGPRFVKLSGRVRYRLIDLQKFIDSRIVETSGE